MGGMPPLGPGAYAEGMAGDERMEQAALVALLRGKSGGARWAEVMANVMEAGSALDVWHARVPDALLPLPAESDPLQVAVADIERWTQSGLRFMTIMDEEYPSQLRAIHEAPPVLFTRGMLVGDDRAVSVVGSRKASERGLLMASAIARSLVGAGMTIVAGLALGVDTAAHRAALDAGGRTVAFIGTGINRTYPAQNRSLHEEIAEKGLLASQFWPDAPPQKFTFLMRNATMSGYGCATVVVEAGEQSGARAQARMAVSHGRPVILTDLVVEKNTWAQAMVGRPGVRVASSTQEVVDIVCGLVRGTADVEDALRHLVQV